MVEELNSLKERVKKLLSLQSQIKTNLNLIQRRHPNRKTEITPQDLLLLGNNISLSLHAPRHWKPGAVLIAGYPPAPQTENMRKGKLGNNKINVINSIQEEGSDLLNQLQEEIQLTAKVALMKRVTNNDIPISNNSNNNNNNNKSNLEISNNSIDQKRVNSPPSPPEIPSKRQRTININFGFESDSESD